MMITTHKLEFEVAPDKISDALGTGYSRFRIGTCEGLWKPTGDAYEILAIDNNEPGNGHLEDVFEWFEASCRRDGKKLRIMEVGNKNFRAHLLKKRGFVSIGRENVEKTFVQ